MKKLIAVVALAFAVCQPAPASTLLEAQEDTAYIAGRCYVHMSEAGLVAMMRFFDSQEAGVKAALYNRYYAGVQDARSNPFTEEQCGQLLAYAQSEMQRLS